MSSVKRNRRKETSNVNYKINQLVKTVVDLKTKDTDIKDGHDEMRNDSYTVSFPLFGFCGRPVKSIQDVLTKGGEQSVRHLTEE